MLWHTCPCTWAGLPRWGSSQLNLCCRCPQPSNPPHTSARVDGWQLRWDASMCRDESHPRQCKGDPGFSKSARCRSVNEEIVTLWSPPEGSAHHTPSCCSLVYQTSSAFATQIGSTLHFSHRQGNIPLLIKGRKIMITALITARHSHQTYSMKKVKNPTNTLHTSPTACWRTHSHTNIFISKSQKTKSTALCIQGLKKGRPNVLE